MFREGKETLLNVWRRTMSLKRPEMARTRRRDLKDLALLVLPRTCTAQYRSHDSPRHTCTGLKVRIHQVHISSFPVANQLLHRCVKPAARTRNLDGYTRDQTQNCGFLLGLSVGVGPCQSRERNSSWGCRLMGSGRGIGSWEYLHSWYHTLRSNPLFSRSTKLLHSTCCTLTAPPFSPTCVLLESLLASGKETGAQVLGTLPAGSRDTRDFISD